MFWGFLRLSATEIPRRLTKVETTLGHLTVHNQARQAALLAPAEWTLNGKARYFGICELQQSEKLGDYHIHLSSVPSSYLSIAIEPLFRSAFLYQASLTTIYLASSKI